MAGCTSCGKAKMARDTKSVATKRGQTTKPSGGVGKTGLVTKPTAYAGAGAAKMGMTSMAKLGSSGHTARTGITHAMGGSRRRGH